MQINKIKAICMYEKEEMCEEVISVYENTTRTLEWQHARFSSFSFLHNMVKWKNGIPGGLK